MNTLPKVSVGPLLAALLASLTAPLAGAAEDIDLYAGTSTAAGAPNVLFALDNSSNWSSTKWIKQDVYDRCTSPKYTAAQTAICQAYVNAIFGSSGELQQGNVQIRALKLVLNEAYCNQADATKKLSFNAGLMLWNDQGTADGPSVVSGYIRHAIKPMSATQCTGTGSDLTQFLIADLDNIDSKIQNTFKGPSSVDYGSMLYEAYKYFGAWTNPAGAPGGNVGGSEGAAGTPTDSTHFGPVRYSVQNSLEDPSAFTNASKTTYASPIDANGSCGNNYIIFVGNFWPNQEYGTSVPNSGNATNTLLTRLGSSPPQIYPQTISSNDKTDIRFADEWAQFLYTTDVSSAPGKQNVRMFTIDVTNGGASPTSPKQTALLKSMANAGQGTTDNSGYFPVGGDLYALITGLKDALTQIASINSVFASPALPASVNSQGIFLNQVFMGAFRPDEEARQRWAGNLKQYQFKVLTTTGKPDSLLLADAGGVPAVDSAKSGFLQNCATSFWTTDSGAYWKDVNGLTSVCSTSTYSLYSDAPDGPIVERGGAGQKLRTLGHASRNVTTCNGAGCSSLKNFDASTVTAINGLSSTDATTLVNWARGQNTGDGSPDTAGTVTFTTYSAAGLTSASTRPTVHGEVIHGTPLAINYGTKAAPNVVVYYGAGDGMLHAIDGSQTGATAGKELWAFIAPEHYTALNRVRTNYPLISYPSVSSALSPVPKTYFFDGSISGYQDTSATNKAWIFPTMRRGGNMIYAFDVTQKPSSSSLPTPMWRFGCATPATNCATLATGEANMGQSWSAPTAIRVKGHVEPLVVFGAGYHTCEDSDLATTCDSVTQGRGVYVLNASQGTAVAADYRNFAFDSTAGRFVADVAQVDINGDGYTDVLYAVDTRGNIWRINTSNPANNFDGFTNGVADWPAPVKVATVSDWSIALESRKFMYAPSVVALGTQTLVLVGTGDREKPLDSSGAAKVNNRFYGIRDDVTKTTAATVTTINGYGAAAVGVHLADLVNVTNQTTVDKVAMAARRGWFMDLSSNAIPFEQVVTTPLTIAGTTYFNTYQAKNTGGANSCSNLGTARAYKIDFETGIGKPNSINQAAPDIYLSQGIPPSPVGGLVSIDGKSYPFCIACGGPSVLSPTNPLVPVRPNRKPIYRYQRVDK